ncbi:MAG: lipase family protein, partial [Rectinemataceae bacterium]
MLGFPESKAKAIALIEAELGGAVPEGWTMEAFDDGFLDIEGAVFRDGSATAWFIFRCTDSNKNWFTNFIFAKKSIAYGNEVSKVRLHLGFFLDYTGFARGFVHAWLKDHPEVTSVVMAGHSLGGALATLCAVDVQYN